MFKEMRRKEKQLSAKETIEIVKSGEHGVLATIGADGYPYAVPLNYAYHEGKIYFHCATSGHKLVNIENEANVSFCIVDGTEIIPEKFTTRFRSVVVFGKAAEVHSEEKKEGLVAIARRFSPEYMDAGDKYIKNAWDKTKVVKIEIEHMTGKGKN